MTKKRALLIGDYEQARYHSLAGVDRELTGLLAGEFGVDIRVDYDRLDAGGLAPYDLLISYVDTGPCEEKLGPTFSAAVISFLCAGGGLVVIHNGIFLHCRHELAMAAGARLTRHPPYVKNIPVAVCEPRHPVTEGMESFTIDDEPFNFELDSFTDLHMLLEYRFGNRVLPSAWCHSYGRGRVVVTALGHEEVTFRHGAYRQFVRRCAVWAAGAGEGGGLDE